MLFHFRNYLKKMNKEENSVNANLNILLVDDHFVVRKGVELMIGIPRKKWTNFHIP